jgi:phospholipid/cholesterol/gamma-HCH transport system substrate-binding protein
MKLTNEAKVGALVLVTLVLGVVFAWIVGVENPFKRSTQFYVTYNFAGGIEVGSPVRVSGIKVGQVEEVDFFLPPDPKKVAVQEPGSPAFKEEEELTPVRLKISVLEKAAKGIKKDSRFYINLAGVIGERYIEVTPGSRDVPRVNSGETVAGVDPPRIDQLISQSFNLAGKIVDLVERNKGDVTRSIELLYKLSSNLNKTVVAIDESKLFKTDISKLINNLIQITNDVRVVTDKAHSPEGEKTLKLLHDLLWRLEPLDKEAIKQFFQKEGIRAKIL